VQPKLLDLGGMFGREDTVCHETGVHDLSRSFLCVVMTTKAWLDVDIFCIPGR
jgi:hypothetical protein